MVSPASTAAETGVADAVVLHVIETCLSDSVIIRGSNAMRRREAERRGLSEGPSSALGRRRCRESDCRIEALKSHGTRCRHAVAVLMRLQVVVRAGHLLVLIVVR